ncbi:MAG: N-acetylneuraminate synthase family protein [Bacteroidales bacterium]|nr:N-acetylneuraminate synthase family protein [Bacteroidales bacterium]
MKKNKTFIIAEIGQAHEGSLGILHSYIDAVAGTGVDAIKFQTHIAEAESSIYEAFRKNFSYVDKTRYDYWQRMEFTKEQWYEIKQHCESVDLEFISSPFSCLAVDLLKELDMKKYKVASGEICNLLMLSKIAETGKEIILSSGMSSFKELDQTIEFLKPYGNKISVLQCTTKYPTAPEDTGLNVLSELKNRYNLPVGLSDHSGTIFPAIAAVALGAKIIEVHAVFDKKIFGPDSTSSLTINELKTMSEGIRYVDIMLQNNINKNDDSEFIELKKIFGKSLAVNKDLKKGSEITVNVLESKKPGTQGIPAKDFKKVIGKKLKTDKKKYDFLKPEDLI